MHPEYVQYLASVLGVFGAGLQWLRGNRVRDRVVFVIGLIGALGGWALFADWSMAAANPRLFLIQQILVFPGVLSAVFGGTYATSKVATAVVDNFGAKLAAHPMVPVTNNQEVK